jgi:AbrB family looped-hinge helix DNA binding protein
MDAHTYPSGMKATVGERGQVTIPKQLRERLGLRPGQRLVVTEEEGRVILVKDLDDDRIMHVYGTLKLPGTVDEIIDEMRGPAELPPET